jgi:hypothetical protein
VAGRRSRSEADRLVLAFDQSGMSRIAFCRAHGVSAHTLDYYRRMRRGKPEAQKLLPVQFVQASPVGVSQAAPLRVELSNGRRIVVEEGFSASLLQRVVAALEA